MSSSSPPPSLSSNDLSIFMKVASFIQSHPEILKQMENENSHGNTNHNSTPNIPTLGESSPLPSSVPPHPSTISPPSSLSDDLLKENARLRSHISSLEVEMNDVLSLYNKGTLPNVHSSPSRPRFISHADEDHQQSTNIQSAHSNSISIPSSLSPSISPSISPSTSSFSHSSSSPKLISLNGNSSLHPPSHSHSNPHSNSMTNINMHGNGNGNGSSPSSPHLSSGDLLVSKRRTRNGSIEMKLFDNYIKIHGEAALLSPKKHQSDSPTSPTLSPPASPYLSPSPFPLPSLISLPTASHLLRTPFYLLRGDNREVSYSYVSDQSDGISLGVRSTNLVRFQWGHNQCPRRVLIIKKPGEETATEAMKMITEWLIKEMGMEVWIEPNVMRDEGNGTPLAAAYTWKYHYVNGNKIDVLLNSPPIAVPTPSTSTPSPNIIPVAFSDLQRKLDFVICLGGDGTLLFISELFKASVPPVISFALGSLGFLSTFQVYQFKEAIQRVIKGGFHLTLRARVICSVIRKDTMGGVGVAVPGVSGVRKMGGGERGKTGKRIHGSHSNSKILTMSHLNHNNNTKVNATSPPVTPLTAPSNNKLSHTNNSAFSLPPSASASSSSLPPSSSSSSTTFSLSPSLSPSPSSPKSKLAPNLSRFHSTPIHSAPNQNSSQYVSFQSLDPSSTSSPSPTTITITSPDLSSTSSLSQSIHQRAPSASDDIEINRMSTSSSSPSVRETSSSPKSFLSPSPPPGYYHARRHTESYHSHIETHWKMAVQGSFNHMATPVVAGLPAPSLLTKEKETKTNSCHVPSGAVSSSSSPKSIPVISPSADPSSVKSKGGRTRYNHSVIHSSPTHRASNSPSPPPLLSNSSPASPPLLSPSSASAPSVPSLVLASVKDKIEEGAEEAGDESNEVGDDDDGDDSSEDNDANGDDDDNDNDNDTNSHSAAAIEKLSVGKSSFSIQLKNESFVCMNEVIIDRGISSYLTNLDCLVDGIEFTKVQADGIIVATPSGSTAYSLSAGGSMVHPDSTTLLFTPVCPHSLSFRPVVLPDTKTLQITVNHSSRAPCSASFDGRNRIQLNPGDSMLISTSRYPIPAVCQVDATQDWFNAIDNILNWNKRAQQKPFSATTAATATAATASTHSGIGEK